MPKFQEYIDALLKLGLNKNQAKVYITMLAVGPSASGQIIKKSRLHGQIVYSAIEVLIENGLASTACRGKARIFQAASPAVLFDKIRELEALVRNVVPSLEKLHAKYAASVQVKILYGHEGFVSNLQTVVESSARHDKIIRIIGGAAGRDFYRVIGDWYDNYVDLLSRRKVKKWQISPASTAEEFKQKFAREENTILKIMPPAFASIMQTRITIELVSIEIYDVETVVIQIWSQAIAKSYRSYFDFLWKQGKIFAPKGKKI